jgi:UDP-N-acetylglucosamine 1-carboxyvinyltransferase
MQEVIEITGGASLQGSVAISGAKNAALPIMIASLLCSEPCEFSNVPNLEDTNLTYQLLEHFGATVGVAGDKVSISIPSLRATEASFSIVKALRASFWVLGPLLARGRAARVALPGGDIIGARPVDMHIAALAQMGAEIRVKHGVVYATAVDGLKPAKIQFRFPSVGATHQIIMAAALTPGVTTIEGAAREPEIEDLGRFINACGGDVEGAGSDKVVIRGRESLGGARHHLIGDRIEAGTFLLAGVATRGVVQAEGITPAHFGDFLELLQKINVTVETSATSVSIDARRELRAVEVATGPFPKFATDLQAPMMAALCTVPGVSVIEENIFEGRYGHVSELCRMGAQITVQDRLATVQGGARLSAAPVEAFDIRAGAALVIAALSAEGVSQIHEPHHLRRGYDKLEQKLRGLGASIGARVADGDDFALTGC